MLRKRAPHSSTGRFCLLATLLLLVLACSRETIELRVMSFNIEWGGANISFDNVVAAVRQSGADVVGIQEAEGNLQRLADELGWHYNLASYAISRFPLHEPQDAAGRYVFVEVAPGQIVALANVHLPSDPYAPDHVRDGADRAAILAIERSARLPFIKPYLDVLPALAERGIPVFLSGDFNSPSHLDWTAAAVGSRPFLRYVVDWPVSLAVAAAGFRDAWRTVYTDPVAHPGLTWWAKRPALASYTPGDNDPEDRIDFLYFAGPVEVLASQIVGEAGRDDVAISVTPWPSDHRGVIATFRVRPARMPPLLGTLQRVYRASDRIEISFRGAPQVRARIDRLTADGSVALPGELLLQGDAPNYLAGDTLEPGHYQLNAALPSGAQLQSDFWVLADGAQAAIEVRGQAFDAGQPIPLRWQNAPGNRNDYVAVYRPDAAAQYEAGEAETGLPWAYINALPQGELQLDASNAGWGWPLAPGSYVMRLLLDDGYEVLAESAPFEVRASGNAD